MADNSRDINNPEDLKKLVEYLKKYGIELDDILSKTENLTKEQYNYLSNIRKSFDIQSDINSSIKETVKYLKKIKEYDDEILFLEKQIKIEKENSNDESENNIKILDKEIQKLKEKKKLISNALSDIKWGNVVLKQTGKELIKLIGNTDKLITKGYGMIKGTGLFEMDKSIKSSALQMGLLGKQSNLFKDTVLLSAQGLGKLDGLTGTLGISVEEIAKYQSDYSEELGRAVMLGKEGLDAMGEMARGTSLGAEGAAKMAAEMDNFGVSAEKSRDFIQQTMTDASSMGLNTSKVTRNIQNNLKLLNQYNFKNGIKGLHEMALSVSKMGIDMKAIAPMADKLWDIDGAVEMSAQLQVLGGEWSKLADPFKLMYMARNDVKGLTEELGKAAAKSMDFAKDGSIQMSTLEMSRLKKVAEQTGVSYDDIVTAGKNIKKFSKIQTQISFNATDEEKEFLTNVANLDEKGRAYIKVGMDRKYLDTMGSTARDLIDARMKEKDSLKKRAEDAMNFDDKLKALIDGVKVGLYPIVDMMNRDLVPKLNDFVKRFKDEGWGEKLEKFAKVVGELVTSIGGFIIDNPIKSALIVGGAKIAGFLLDKASWILNGLSLATGFKMGMGGISSIGGGTGQIGGSTMGLRNAGAMDKMGLNTIQKVGTNFKSGLKSFGAIGSGVLAAGFAGYDEYSEQMEKGKSQGEAIGRAALKGTGAGLGAWGGAAAGAAIGSVVPVVGTIIGGLIGGALGAWGGGKIADLDTYGVNDGIVFNPNDKFMKVNDGAMIAGTNVNGNKDLARSISSVMSPQPVSSSIGAPGSLKISFDELKLNGVIELKIDNQLSKSLGENLIKDPQFIRNLSLMINKSISQNNNMVLNASGTKK